MSPLTALSVCPVSGLRLLVQKHCLHVWATEHACHGIVKQACFSLGLTPLAGVGVGTACWGSMHLLLGQKTAVSPACRLGQLPAWMGPTEPCLPGALASANLNHPNLDRQQWGAGHWEYLAHSLAWAGTGHKQGIPAEGGVEGCPTAAMLLAA